MSNQGLAGKGRFDVVEPGSRESGLKCPRCNYDLTGLPQPRCPECGDSFDWNTIAANRRPSIAFERHHGVRRVAGFLSTWLCILILPIRFAKQAAQSASPRAGIGFGLSCFAFTPAAWFFGGSDVAFFAAWYAGALVCIALETAMLGTLDWVNLRRHPGKTLCFWLAMGGYTSAIVPTEIGAGPPAMLLEEMLSLLGLYAGAGVLGVATPFPHYFQIASWLVSLLCILFVRSIRSGQIVGVVVLLMPPTAAALLWIHSAACWVGLKVYNWIGDY